MTLVFYIYNIRYLVIFSAQLLTVPFSPQLELRASLSITLNTERIQGFERTGSVNQWPILACSRTNQLFLMNLFNECIYDKAVIHHHLLAALMS